MYKGVSKKSTLTPCIILLIFNNKLNIIILCNNVFMTVNFSINPEAILSNGMANFICTATTKNSSITSLIQWEVDGVIYDSSFNTCEQLEDDMCKISSRNHTNGTRTSELVLNTTLLNTDSRSAVVTCAVCLRTMDEFEIGLFPLNKTVKYGKILV